MPNAPIAHTPIQPTPPDTLVAGWVVSARRSDAPLTLVDCTPLAKILLKTSASSAATESIGIPFGRADRRTWYPGPHGIEVLVTGAAPGEWLALAPPGTGAQLAAWLSQHCAAWEGALTTVLDHTHGRALVRLTGRHAVDVLAKECALDLGGDMFPDGAALRSAVAGLATDLIRDDQGGIRSYLLHCEWSSGQYLWNCLLDAGAEFGIDVEGFASPQR